MTDDAVAPDPKPAGPTIEDPVGERAEATVDSARGRRARRQIPVERLALTASLIAVVLLVGLVGWLSFRAYQAQNVEAKRNLFLEVARQGAINLSTIDYEHADADVQRILDSATGTFYENFSHRSKLLVDSAKQAQSKSVGTVTEMGLESETGNECQVLVAVAVKASNPGGAQQEPQAWRMRITVRKVGDGAKISNVAFVS